MNRLARLLIAGALAGSILRCAAQSTCIHVAVRATVEAGQGELTLADLLPADRCGQLREAATRVSLGTAPRIGSVRVLDGHAIQARLEELANESGNPSEPISLQVPERILVRRAGAAMSCVEISRFVARTASTQATFTTGPSHEAHLDCSAARGVSENASLELLKITWNEALQRREFSLRCARPEDCVPFLVWIREGISPGDATDAKRALQRKALSSQNSNYGQRANANAGGGTPRLVAPGQTATLTWEQSGIRIVLPVTCLEAGSFGQFVRVRLKNAARVLQAEVVGKAMLRAQL